MAKITVDGNQAVAEVAYRASEVIAIYPITPSSTMGELSDEWASQSRPNLWGSVPTVVEMQSEGGAAGAVHGALQAGALATTFTSSQGLLLMIPNLYKIAGELTPFCLHVAARTVATHALSIFGDHSDVMACRQIGLAMLASGSVQEAQDLACIAHAATLESRIPFLHFFDGFRTSHEMSKIDSLDDSTMAALLSEEAIAAHRRRALAPSHPTIRGTAQNPDTWFQAREACNPFYRACPHIVEQAMARFAALTGRRYRLFDYVGHPQADRVIVCMGSGAETAHETVEHLIARGERVGLLKVRLFRPFSVEDFCRALPPTVRRIAALDRTKEPGAIGEPLYQDVVTALVEAWPEAPPMVRGGRYGLSSKELTPAMIKRVFDELSTEDPRNHFTVGIVDDVSGTSLAHDSSFRIEADDVQRALFFGLGADGTVSANKSTIKIIGDATPSFVQGYFVYDSKKSGAVTVSHLRVSPRPLRAAYLVEQAPFVAVHEVGIFERYDILERAEPGATLLVNAAPEHLWGALPREVQEQILQKRIRLYAIDAGRIAKEAGLDGRINTIMQVCHFALARPIPLEAALASIKHAIEVNYGKKGVGAVTRNFAAVDATLAALHEVEVPAIAGATHHRPAAVPPTAPSFVQRVTSAILAGHGDRLPVSAFPVDGTWPVGTARFEKRNLADQLPVWDPAICIQCNKCAFVCPHAAIRPKVVHPGAIERAPSSFVATDYRGLEYKGDRYILQVAPEDCTGCGVCVEICPAKDKANPLRKALEMQPQPPLRERERANWEFFTTLPELPRPTVHLDVKGSQFLEPLFEFSGACAGCGETPYLKLLSQLFGDRALVANATGCSSIYAANLPTTPWSANGDGRGPAWANSLFEDNAEFGLGMRLAVDAGARQASLLLARLAPSLPGALVEALAAPASRDETGLALRREQVLALKRALAAIADPAARRLELACDALVPTSVWIVGGDGWAYDIGFGGLDHVLASGRDVNVLVLDSEVYSNTGGQQSKATPRGASAKFAIAGKATPKKDLGLMAMTYGSVYVASVAFGAKDAHTVKAFLEAESYPGPSLIIGYAHCIAHGYDLRQGCAHQKLAVESGYWPLYRFDPRRDPPLRLDATPSGGHLEEMLQKEMRFRSVAERRPDGIRSIADQTERDVARRLALYRLFAEIHFPLVR